MIFTLSAWMQNIFLIYKQVGINRPFMIVFKNQSNDGLTTDKVKPKKMAPNIILMSPELNNGKTIVFLA